MNLLITGAWQQAQEHIGEIEKQGHRVCFLQYEKDELPCEYDWVEGVICNGLFLSHPIEKFCNLKYIQLTSAGYDRINTEYVEKHGIIVRNARGVYSIPMAEFVMAGVLELYKKMRYFAKMQKEHRWEKNRDLIEVYGKTALIVGCGSVGTECAKRFQAFGCRVIGVDLFPRQDETYEKMLDMAKLEDELPEADIVVLTLPLTKETRHTMNAKRLALLKDTAILVNIARGEVVETEALLAVSERIGGMILDVFENEPLDADSALWDKENVIITPHNSFVGEGNGERLSRVIINNLVMLQD